MIALCVDDEPLLLDALIHTVRKLPDITETVRFTDENEALKWGKEHDFDIALLDIRMHEMGGMELARRLRPIRPKARYIFCTGYMEYAPDVINESLADGYLLKPISLEKLQELLDRLEAKASSHPLLTIRCRGSFEVFDQNGNPLSFRRSRAREILAILADCAGEPIAPWDISNKLWIGSDSHWDERTRNYLYQQFFELNRALREVGAAAVLKKNSLGHFLDMSLVRLRDDGQEDQPYLSEYPWASRT